MSRRATLPFVIALVALLASATLASLASGADRVYWSNNGNAGGPQGISYANLDGSGGGADLKTTGATLGNPVGSAIDIATGRIFWANSASDAISFANLDGSGGGDLNTAGATLSLPFGIAVDPAAGRIYWSNSGASGGPQGISSANLDGSGAGADLNTTGATLNFPEGIAIDPAGGRIYWTNTGIGGGSQGVSFANLDGSGGGDVNTTGATLNVPIGLAVDSATGRVYWANSGLFGGSQGVSFAGLNGSSGGDLDLAGATVNTPIGLAVDSDAGKVYWANAAAGGSGPQGVSFVNLDGSGGGGDLSVSGATLNNVNSPSLLKTPVGSGAPKLSGRHGHRSKLSCTQGSWASDLLPAQLYRAPTTFAYSWSRYAKSIHGASASTYRPHAVGNYRCTVTAQNPAGEALQSSSVHAAFRLAKLYRNKRRGAAKLIVKLPGRGRVILSGHKAKHLSRRTHLASKKRHLHKAALLIRAKGSAKRKLNRTGRVKLKVKVKFDPKTGAPGTLSRTVTLRFRLPPRRVIPASATFPLGLGRVGR